MGVSVHVLVVSIMRLPLYSALQTVYSVPVFCIFVAVWSQMMLEGWKKQEARLAFKWGMDLYEESELERSGLSLLWIYSCIVMCNSYRFCLLFVLFCYYCDHSLTYKHVYQPILLFPYLSLPSMIFDISISVVRIMIFYDEIPLNMIDTL